MSYYHCFLVLILVIGLLCESVVYMYLEIENKYN